jgi:CCR4-NOT transcriptional regulation complex NOT5 subunit
MERPKIKDKEVLAYVEYLEAQLKSPFAESYMVIKQRIDKGNRQALTTEINIFDPKDEEKSKQIDKFIDKLEGYVKQLAYFKSKMNPSEIEASDKIVSKEGGVEEYLKTQGQL